MSLLPERSTEAKPDPRPPFPNGWLSIGFSEEVRVGEVVSRHALGRDLVLFRGEDAALTVADAYCPHLGAHLGDGDVVGGTLRCPFHHWQFDGGGRCAAIPYGSNRPANAVLQTYPCDEVNGFIFIWFHGGGAAPGWSIPGHPVVADPAYQFVEKREYLFRAHPQDVSENGADFAHFIAIHGWDGVGLQFVPEGHAYRVGYDTENVDTGYGAAGNVGVDSLAVGPGYTYTHYTGENDWLMMTCFTPVDPGILYLHQLYYGHRTLPKYRAQALIEAVDREWRKDIRIWENKVYRERPVLNNGDGPVARFRRWYAQFYA